MLQQLQCLKPKKWFWVHRLFKTASQLHLIGTFNWGRLYLGNLVIVWILSLEVNLMQSCILVILVQV